jgi:hypothetical protein
MFEFLAACRAVLEICTVVARLSGARLLQPLLTAACLTGVYALIHISQEGGLRPGLRAAFFDNEAARSERRRMGEQVVLQSELRQFVTANKLIDQLLMTLLTHSSGASRVQLNVIHNGVTGLTGTSLLRYDVANTVTAPGRSAGEMLVNLPLTEWADFLPSLIAQQCSFHRVSELESASSRARFEALGAVALLVCPAADVEGKIVGAIFFSWDANDPLPNAAALQNVMAEGLHLGGQIAAILDLRATEAEDEEVNDGLK